MKTLLVVGLFQSVALADDDWQQSTVDGYQHTISANFEALKEGDSSKNICVVIEPTDRLKEKLTAKNQANAQTPERFKAKKAYRREVHKQKVLCMSRYNNGREKIAMFSYFDGKRGYRVHCQVDDRDFVCYNRSKQYRYLPAKFTVLADSGNLIERITELGYRKFSDDGKLFRLKTDYVSRRQKVFFPWHSKEQPEFQGNKQQFINITTSDGSRSLPVCGHRVDGFAERVVCHDHFKGQKSYCPSGTTDQKITLCKLARQKGILIEQDDGILRVASCEYQPAAMHFYCSGKLQGESTPKVYYERYGVQLVEADCPRYAKQARVESLKCTQQLTDKSCDSFAGDIKNRCQGIVRDEGCNFYRNLEHGEKCPELAELLSGLGCSPTARHDDPCDFRYDDRTVPTYSGGGSTPAVETPPAVTLPAPNPGEPERPVVDTRDVVAD